jgi:hypothetical protein
MKTLQSLRPMTATIPWHTPSPRPLSAEEQEIYDDLDSHVLLPSLLLPLYLPHTNLGIEDPNTTRESQSRSNLCCR